jgi:16S rRNA (guanine527-N7)-methyltransferase
LIAPSPAFRAFLLDGLRVLGQRITSGQLGDLDKLRGLVQDENRRQNLTSAASDFDLAVRHVLDSLTCLRLGELLAGPVRAVDIGTGAGFPGLPLALVRPQIEMTLLDSSRKRTAFLQMAVTQLGLGRCRVVAERAENFGHRAAERESFDLVVVRAVAHLAVDLEYGAALARPGGHLVILKGPRVSEELATGIAAGVKLGVELAETHELVLPLADERRVLVVFRKTQPTPETYPRREGLPAKRPLA